MTTTPVAEPPQTVVEPVFTANFTISINGIKVGNIDNLTDVIKRVDFTVTGTKDSTSFSLPQSIELDNPQANSFVPFEQVTEADVISWIEANFTGLTAVKQHIEYALDKEIAKNKFTSKNMPWAPAITIEPAPAANTTQPNT